MMPAQSATLRHMQPADLALVLGWAAAEGWNPGLSDALPFLAADPEGFFLAEAGGEAIGAISVVNHSPEQAFLGLFICRPDWRGLGLGRRLWALGLAHAGGRCIGLDGVAAQEANYARAGFVRTGATTRLEGRIAATCDPAVRPVVTADIPALIALDASAGGFARPAFVGAWLGPAPDRHSLILPGKGFVTIRRCRLGAKIGPLIAPDAQTALRLIRAAVAACPEGPLWIDLPDMASPLAQHLLAEGFTPVFTTARMYRGKPPLRGKALQAIATMELG